MCSVREQCTQMPQKMRTKLKGLLSTPQQELFSFRFSFPFSFMVALPLVAAHGNLPVDPTDLAHLQSSPAAGVNMDLSRRHFLLPAPASLYVGQRRHQEAKHAGLPPSRRSLV